MGRPIKFTILLYLLFSMFLHGQSPEYQRVFVDTDNFGESYLDDLRDAYSKVTNNDTLQYSILNDLSYYWHTRNLKKAIQCTEMGLQLTTLNSDTLWHGRFQITQGAILLRMEKLDSAQTVLEEAMAKVPERDLAFLNTQMGYVYERRGQLDKAAGYVLESLRLGNLFQDKKAIALAYSDLSNIFWKQSKFIKGLEYGLKAINIFEERGINDLDYDFTLYVVGNNYLMLQEYDNALKFYDHAKAIGERYGFYNNLSDIYISLVELYCSLDNYEAAEKAGKNAIKYAKLLDNNFLLMRAYLSVGKLQNLQGKYSSAIESLQESIEVATENFGDEYYLSQAYEALGKALAGNHNYREAYKAFSEYDKLKKIVFNAESDQRIALLQTEFDVAQKENTILLQQTKIRKQNTNQILSFIITGLLLFLVILGFVAIKNNRKKNVLLQLQNDEKEFLIKEIHHRVKNNLEVVSSLLSLQTAQIKDANIKDAMFQIQSRIESMSMIHQNLYHGKRLTSIGMRTYFIKLADYILDSYGARDRITMVYKMKDIELNVDIATPIGLIVNELVTNSLKYAFPGNVEGTITIELEETDSVLELRVMDNGVGFTEETEVQGTGFGTQLVKLLTQQLDGKMRLKNNKGTDIFFEFQLHKAA
ncbi:tetratricopeptide repeat-containing sensor histidine kinase [Arenibacter amylolyticus]|uniref:tetratricopeptide repeat-containing sensor histidine kinase n=1 Tax=Arenibacter amylolyticus TaxID=1406873 RepID=UPI000A37C854|nr:histidine kinase dimerization/phosphoacceptor domain -containing protein [Arenibacter amylolyticus]